MLYSLTVETTSNNNTGYAMQWLMPSGKACQLIAVMIKQSATANPETSGRWAVDRISAVGNGTSQTLVPLLMNPAGAASAITDTAHTVSTTLACNPTVVTTTGVAILDLADGWNMLKDFNILSGQSQGFAIKRYTAPTGSRVVTVTAVWSE